MFITASELVGLVLYPTILFALFRWGVLHFIRELQFYRSNDWDFRKDSGEPVIGGLKMLMGDRYLSPGLHKIVSLGFLSLLFVLLLAVWMNAALR